MLPAHQPEPRCPDDGQLHPIGDDSMHAPNALTAVSSDWRLSASAVF